MNMKAAGKYEKMELAKRAEDEFLSSFPPSGGGQEEYVFMMLVLLLCLGCLGWQTSRLSMSDAVKMLLVVFGWLLSIVTGMLPSYYG